MSTATKKTLADVALVSELKDLGWSVKEAPDGKTWTAHENAGDLRDVGPASSIKALHTQVKLAAGAPEATDADGQEPIENFRTEPENANPDGRLPGLEEPEIGALNVQADKCIDAFEKKKKAAAESKDQDDVMRKKLKESGRKRYSRHGWSIVIEDSEKLVIKKADGSPALNPKATSRQPRLIKKNG